MYYYKETETAVIQFFSFIEDRIVYQLELNLVGSSVGEVTPEIKACDFFDADVLVLFCQTPKPIKATKQQQHKDAPTPIILFLFLVCSAT
jgi:hypothetical protein